MDAAAEAGEGARTPDVSVVISLADHRGQALAAVESAALGQDWGRDRFEVLAVGDGADPALERAVARRLGAGDRLVHGHGTNTAALAHQGAVLAAGRILFFTEGHCRLAPDCVRELVRFFDAGDHDAACVGSTGLDRNAFARMEQRAFEEAFREWSRPDDWRKVMFRGFAVRRQVYEETGGFEWRYSIFADRALAATLHAGKYRVGCAERVHVVHVDTTRYAELRHSIEEYVAGELRYLEEHDPDYCLAYFGEPEEWLAWRQRGSFEARAGLAAALSCLLQRRRDGPPGSGAWQLLGMVRAVAHLLGQAVPGSRLPVLRAALGVVGARLAYAGGCVVPEARRFAAYARLWRRTAGLARTRLLAGRAPERRPAIGPGRVSAEALPRHRAFGLHALERHGERPFRWTRPVAGFWLDLPPGAHRVTLETAGLRTPGRVAVYWDGRRVAAVERREEAIHVDVAPGRGPAPGGRPLVVVADPVPRRPLTGADPRPLGLALLGLRVSPTAPGRDASSASSTRRS